ncbi:MAG: STAS/SEC14 domain-containing protein, partial [Gallionella sp.]|nr:STAS/SEC14 domain-containing protein [Gallionella sp.]
MITIEQTDNLVNAAVLGEFTLADFKAFEEQSLYKLKAPGTLNLLFDLRGMLDYSVDVAWEEIKFFNR